MIIIRKDGTVIDVGQYGLSHLKHHIPSLSPSYSRETIENRDGDIVLGATYPNRTIAVEFKYKSYDIQDYYLLLSEFNRLFAIKESFYICFKREPTKRWLVRLDKSFLPDKFNQRIGTLQVEFITENPFAESIGTTLDSLTFDADKWGFGQGLLLDDMIYTYSTNTFKIFNAGDIAVDPRNLKLIITFQGASTNLTITNQTTGDIWALTGTTLATDTIKIDGVRSLKNGTSIFSQTNRKLITIQPGWNDFAITGATDFIISFDFRFYYF